MVATQTLLRVKSFPKSEEGRVEFVSSAAAPFSLKHRNTCVFVDWKLGQPNTRWSFLEISKEILQHLTVVCVFIRGFAVP